MEHNKIQEEIGEIVSTILDDYKQDRDIDKISVFNQPDHEAIISITTKLQRILFPGFFRDKVYKIYSIDNSVATLTEDVVYNLNKQIVRVLKYNTEYADYDWDQLNRKAEEITLAFLRTIPKIRALLDTDLSAAYDGDPAATGKDEVIYAYPGIRAISIYRMAHELYTRKVPLLPRMMTEHAHSLTGIDINPGAQIGEYFFMDHGTGIVIGETTEIGNWCKLYQGVTLGALSTSLGQQMSGVKRHPKLEDHVTIYSNASILGGETVIGEGAVVGGSAFITESVPAHARVVMNGEVSIRVKK